MNTTLLIGTGLAVVATLLDIIGVAIPNWLVIAVGRSGLFRVCADILGTTVCGDIPDSLLSDWWKATSAMMVLSILAMGSGVVLAVLFGFVMKDKQVLALGAAGLTLAGGVLALIGVIIFGAKVTEVNGSAEYLHAGFGLAVVAAILAFPASAVIMISKNRNV